MERGASGSVPQYGSTPGFLKPLAWYDKTCLLHDVVRSFRKKNVSPPLVFYARWFPCVPDFPYFRAPSRTNRADTHAAFMVLIATETPVGHHRRKTTNTFLTYRTNCGDRRGVHFSYAQNRCTNLYDLSRVPKDDRQTREISNPVYFRL